MHKFTKGLYCVMTATIVSVVSYAILCGKFYSTDENGNEELCWMGPFYPKKK